MHKKPFFIRAEWDEEAEVWVASSDDVPGLATEERNLEDLIQKLKVMVPELLEANGFKKEPEPLTINYSRFSINNSLLTINKQPATTKCP